MARMTVRHGLLATAALLAAPSSALGWGSEADISDLSLDLVSPVSPLFSVSNDFVFTSFQGDLPGADDQETKEWRVTAAYPWKLSNGKNLVLRATVPVNEGEPFYPTEVREYAEFLIRQRADVLPRDGGFLTGHSFMDDIEWDLAYGSVNDEGLMTMVGLAGVLPISQDGSIERDQYLLGPQAAVGKVADWGTIGVWAQQLVSVADQPSNDLIDYDTNETRLKFFFAWRLGNGWQLISNPTVVYDWEAVSDNKLLLPVGLGIAKTTRFGRLPIRFELEVEKYLESPEAFGPDVMFRLNIMPVLMDRRF